MRSSADRGSYSLRVPTGLDERITPRFVSSAGIALFETPHATEAGIYELRRATQESAAGQPNKGELVQAVAVNVDPTESDLRPVTENELSAFWSHVGVSPEQTTSLEAADKIDATILEARFGVELWKYFVGLALTIAFLEMAIGRAAKPHYQHQS
jgi:hypothetical protein